MDEVRIRYFCLYSLLLALLPLAGFVGKIKELNDSAQKAKVNVLMFGRNTDVEVEYVQIRKLNLTEPAPTEQRDE